jgi:hypothetical protein
MTNISRAIFTRRLYQVMNDVVVGLKGQLQVIAVDHAEFDEDWFTAAVVERWRDGEALIPKSWIPRLLTDGST